MGLRGHFSKLRHLPIVTRLFEISLVISMHLLMQYGGLLPFDSDPHILPCAKLQSPGWVPCKMTNKMCGRNRLYVFFYFSGGASFLSDNLGQFCVNTYLFTLLVLFFAYLAGDAAPIVNFLTDSLGGFLFLSLAVVQFVTWTSIEEAGQTCQEITGCHPRWIEPTVPRLMATMALLMALMLLGDTIVSIYSMQKERLLAENRMSTSVTQTRKSPRSVKFNQESIV